MSQVDTKPQLKTEDISTADGESDQEQRFLISIYNTINYPRYARENGVRAMVEVTYLVDVNGAVSIDKTRTLTPEETTNIDVSKKEVISIVAYGMRPPNGSLGTSVSPPRQTKNKKRLAKAYKSLEEAAAASIRTLPGFIPGSHKEKSVVVRAVQLFTFQLE
jgi:hypothetical protein